MLGSLPFLIVTVLSIWTALLPLDVTVYALCTQVEPCATGGSPVCGSDGKTYRNLCELQRTQCTKVDLAMAYLGPCRTTSTTGGSGSASDVTIDTPVATTTASSSSSSAVPADCSPTACFSAGKDAVCGSNNVTYSNECWLEVAQCQGLQVVKQSDGACASDASAASWLSDASVAASGSADSSSSSSTTSKTTMEMVQIVTLAGSVVVGILASIQ